MTVPILRKRIKELGVSTLFAATCESMGYPTLEAILSEKPEQIREKRGFSYTWLGELIDVLDKNGLLHLLQPMQGNSGV